jgi:hypothetical protein
MPATSAAWRRRADVPRPGSGRPVGRSPVCVYAIIANRGAPASLRVAGQRFRIVRQGAIAAVVNDDARRRAPAPVNLRRYDRVVRELAERFPAMIPARFGTLMAEDELTFTLSSRRAALAAVLKRVRNRVQMTIRVMRIGSPLNAPHGGEGPLPATGRDYLIARARTAAAARAVPGFDPVREAVSRWVRDERVEHQAGVSSVYHLIPRASVTAYRAALRTSAAAANVKAIVTGPWPPYAFASPD